MNRDTQTRIRTRLSTALAGVTLACVPALVMASEPPAGCSGAAAADKVLCSQAQAKQSKKVSNCHLAKKQIFHEIQANLFTTSTQENIAIDVDPRTGNMIAVWDSRRQEAGTYGVYARLFDSVGQPLSPEMHINNCIDGIQRRPAVAFDPNNSSAWFTWESSSQDGSGNGVIARRFNADFTDASNEIAVNATRNGSQTGVSVSTNAQGQALFAWATPATAINNVETGATELRVRLFNADGTAQTDEVVLAAGAHDHTVTLTALPHSNEFLAAWTQTDHENDSARIMTQRIDASNGSLVGKAVAVSESDGQYHVEPSIAATEEGRYAIAWMTSEAGDAGYAVSLRRFDAQNDPIDAKSITVAAAETEAWKSGATIALQSDGQLAVAYNQSTTRELSDDVYVRTFNFSDALETLEPAVRVNKTDAGRQYLSIASGSKRMAWSNQGSLVVAWNGKSESGDSSGANISIMSTDTLADATTEPALLETQFAYVPTSSSDYDTPIPPIYDPNWAPIEPMVHPLDDDMDFGFEAVQSTGWTPPDPEMAVGTDTVVVMTNGEISCFEKDGTQLWEDEIENNFGFWGAQGADNFVFDPEVLWDPHTSRYFAMACERSDNGRSMFLLAISKDGRPETANDWWKHRIDVTGISDNDIDSPNMGVDANHVYLTADFFGPDKYLVYAIEKAALLSGGMGATGFELIVGGSQQSMGIPTTWDSAAPAQYIIQSTENTNNNTVILHAVEDPTSGFSRTTFSLPVSNYTYPAQPPQKGTSSRPFLFEPRFWSCVYRDGSLWAVHHVNSSRTRVRWYEIDMAGWPNSGNNPSVAQWGEIDPGNSIYTFFPSIGVDGQGNAAITFARSSTSEFISMSRAVRAVGDAQGTFRAPEVVKESNGYTTAGRWGDYSFTQADPTTDGVFWGHHEWQSSNNVWRTWVGKYELVIEDRINLATSPLIAGQSVDLKVSNATANKTVYFAYTLAGLGSKYIPALDVTMEIASPALAGTDVANAVGEAAITRNVPGGMSGVDVWLQAVQKQRRSNVIADTVQ